MLNKQGKKGKFLVQTVKNMNEKCQKAIEIAKGIDYKMSLAQSTINKITE